MLTYNTHLPDLVLPEYGRNIQRMVDFCLTIENRDERTACAQSIIRSMGNLFPELRAPENAHKLWDHLMIMAGFRLDVDFPCEVISQADLATSPEPVGYSQHRFAMRHYGKITQDMVRKAAEMEEGPERDALVLLLANHMKKQMLAVNPDGVEDAKVFTDLYNISEGRIRLDANTVRLHEFKAQPVATGKKKKKK